MSTSTATLTTDKVPLSVWPDVSLLGVALIWGVNIPLMKTGLEQVDVFVFNAVRLTVSALALGVLALRERRRGIIPTGIRFRQILIYSTMVSATYQLCFLIGMNWTTSGNTALIIATVPMWTALLARVFISEHLSKIAWCGLGISLLGTIIVALQKGDVTTGREHLLGNLTILGAALLWACGTVYSRPMLAKISPLQLAASASLIALPVHYLVAFARFEGGSFGLNGAGIWLIILYSGMLSSGLSQPMWHFGVKHAGAAHAAIIQNLIPLVAIAVAWLTRGEPATTPQLVGGSLIISGLFIMRLTRKNQ